MPVGDVPTKPAPSDLAWRVIGLVNLYRLLVPPVLLSMQWLPQSQATLQPIHPQLFLGVCIAYFTAGVLLVVARRLSWPTLRRIALVNAGIDAAAISLILYACGGVSSGLGILLVLPVGAMAVLADNRDAFLIAAFAALGVLAQQIFSYFTDSVQGTDFTGAGVLGVVLFTIVLAVWPVANRLRESEALVRRQEVDLANLAQLSQYIVQHLRESILVVDTEDRIRLINESAAQILGDRLAVPDALLGEASPRLLYLLETWRQNTHWSGDEAAHTFVAADGGRVVRPHFASLGGSDPTPVLVFLEDTSLLAEQVQQSKLAALGRLSASIAHEIRNPVGAMSHASQLLAESSLSAEDLRLTQIIRANADRVSTIIDNVLQLSKRGETRLERLSLALWIEEFHDEFCETMQLKPDHLRVVGHEDDIEVRADPTQLHQVVWNLCDNALRHGLKEDEDADIEIRYGRLNPGARPFLEVADRGPGVNPEHAERIFEPFFSGGQGGTGLGLFLARELAQTNGATLLHESRVGGGSLFRLVFADPRRWELR